MMTYLRKFHSVILLASAVASLLAADPLATTGPTVQLPEFDVRELPIVPDAEPWLYAALPGVEALSEIDPHATNELLARFAEQKADLDLAWSALGQILGREVALPAGDLPVAPPLTLLFVNGARRLDEYQAGFSRGAPSATAGVTLSFRRAETNIVVFNAADRTLNLPTLSRESLQLLSNAIADSRPTNAQEESDTNIANWIHNTSAEVAKVVNSPRALAREYIRLLCARESTRPLPWFEEGLAQLLANLGRDKDSVALGRLDSPDQGVPLLSYMDWRFKVQEASRLLLLRDYTAVNALQALFSVAEETEGTFNHELRYRTLLPLPQLFAMPRGAPESRYPIGSVWAKQCEAFVHYCLFGHHETYRPGFARWVGALQRGEAPTESLFEQCFARKYAAFISELKDYVDGGPVFRPLRVRVKGGLAAPPAFALRSATDAEVGRLKSQALLAAGDTTAARAFAAATFVRGARAPDFLATLGIVESAAGNSERALRLLSAIQPQLTAQPRALLELSRLRLAAALARNGGALLSDDDTIAVLTPLMQAHAQPPALIEIPIQIARVWEASSFQPDPRQLQLLATAVQAYPESGELVVRTTRLFLGAGQADAASVLVDYALKQKISNADKQFLRKLVHDAKP